jgi:hypothetical protein
VQPEPVQPEQKRGRGRPRLYPVEVAQDGAPILAVRLSPELLAWVKERGGSAYVRVLIERAMTRCEERVDSPSTP